MKIFTGLLICSFPLIAQTSPWVGDIGGLILTTRGRGGIPSVEIEITGVNSDYLRTRFSSGRGLFNFEQVPAGNYKVTLRKKGFISVAMIVEVKDHKNAGMVVYMKPKEEETTQKKD